MFLCDTFNCKKPVGYPALFDHCHLNGLKWSNVLSAVGHDIDMKPTVLMLLKALELPDDMSLAAMEDMDGRLICLCGHPDFRKPLTFSSMVSFPCLLRTSFLKDIRRDRSATY
jgi:hypothetical protein